MTEVVTFAVLGIGAGALYVLLALGIVIVHRASGVVNFAQGAIGMIGTYVFWDLRFNDHYAYAAAALAGIAVSAIVGLLSFLLVIRPLSRSSTLIRTTATLGVLTVLEQAAALHYPSTTLSVPSQLPVNPVTFAGITVGVNQLWILLIVVVSAAILGVVYRYTKFGRYTTATAENRRALALLGVSPDRITAVNWAVSGALAGVAGILLAPITGLDVTQFTFLVLPALAAAVIGGLASFPVTVAGGLVLGILQSELGRYVTAPGWASAAPFLLIVIVLAVRGTGTRSRSQLLERLPELGTGRIRWTFIVPSLLIALVGVEFLPANWEDAVTTTITAAIILLSLVVVTGYSGQLSLAQFAFAGWGAWIAGRLVATTGIPFELAILVAVAGTIPLGIIIGLVCLRTIGANLAIATLGLTVAIEQIVFDSTSLTGGLTGTTIGSPHLFGWDVNAVTHPNRYAMVCLVLFGLSALAVANMRRGRSGRRIVATRANDRAAASLGISTAGARLYAFALASGLASLGGVLIAFQTTSIVYSNFDSLSSVQFVAEGVVGGIGWIVGALLGAVLQVGSVATQVLNYFGPNVANYLPLAGGVLLIITLLAARNGLAFENWRLLEALRARYGKRRGTQPLTPLPAALPRRVAPATLSLNGVTVQFGGVTALDAVSMSVGPAEVVGLIGPNGAGKTTLIDAVTGFVRSRGAITLDDRDIRGRSTSRLANLGVARSFQSVELFEDMTILDNLRVASEPRDSWSYLKDLFWPRKAPLSAATVAAIREFGLEDVLSLRPAELPYGLRRLVGMARAVAREPSILLLDEPAAGLDDGETAELAALIRRLASDWGMGILLIEHHVEMVMGVCDRVYALNFGTPIAAGTPSEVRRADAVIKAYLGSENPPASTLA
jgi:ABC-type branched-subunit amino acid transport system ATPase component/branched-subunit amino acid ABC-type transport system permease component